MLNEPPRSDEPARKTHPLNQPPQALDPEQYRGQRGTVRIAVVKPYAVWALIAINAMVYLLLTQVLSEQEANEIYGQLATNKQAVLGNGEFYRLLTAMFLHSLVTPYHIVFNMFALYAIGVTVERFFGHARFLIIYLLGGITSSILSTLITGTNVYSAGASGAVFAIVSAEVVFFFVNRKLWGKTGQFQVRQLIIISAMNFAVGLLDSFGGGTIDNWGHLGGFVGGLILAWILSPRHVHYPHPTEPNAFVVEDINPLVSRVQPVLIYSSVLLIALIFGALVIV